MGNALALEAGSSSLNVASQVSRSSLPRPYSRSLSGPFLMICASENAGAIASVFPSAALGLAISDVKGWDDVKVVTLGVLAAVLAAAAV